MVETAVAAGPVVAPVALAHGCGSCIAWVGIFEER